MHVASFSLLRNYMYYAGCWKKTYSVIFKSVYLFWDFIMIIIKITKEKMRQYWSSY